MDLHFVFSLRNLLSFSDSFYWLSAQKILSHPELWQVFISIFSNFGFTQNILFYPSGFIYPSDIRCVRQYIFLCLQIARFFNRFRWTESWCSVGPEKQGWGCWMEEFGAGGIHDTGIFGTLRVVQRGPGKTSIRQQLNGFWMVPCFLFPPVRESPFPTMNWPGFW